MKHKSLALLLLTFFCALPLHTAQARVDILPRIVVIESRERSGEITILNFSDKTSVFRINITAYKQQLDGGYHQLEEPLNPVFNPEEYVRISPRQFSLPPGGRQKVRISLRKPADLPEGEYRFHVAAVQYDQKTPDDPKPERGAGVHMAMNMGVTIPVIVRHGSLEATAKIENARLGTSDITGRDALAIMFDLVRSGNKSVLGHANVYWKPANGEEREIGITNGLNVFTELDKREVVVILKENPAGPGTLRIRYTSDFGNKEVIDEVALSK